MHLSLTASLYLAVALAAGRQAKRRVVMLSFDGFRWDYIGKYETPNFDYLAATGVHAAMGVQTAFVTKTFPDHYTLATGLYEESHGIVNNRMYDPLFNETFTRGNLDPKWWDGGEPIWITARLQGLNSATYFWPGSEVKLKNVSPNFFVPYNRTHSFKHRADTIMDWLVNKHIDLVVAYFHEPDYSGHHHGAFSQPVGKAVKMVDDTLGYLIDRLKDANLFQSTDLIIVGDHGMVNATEDEEHTIVLSDYLDLESEVVIVPQEGPLAAILPRPGKLDIVYEKLKDVHPHMTVFKKENLPDRFHYKKHRRIMPILALADEGYQVIKTRPHDLPLSNGPVSGEHGYDNELRSMRPIFFAHGPDFKENYIAPVFETVNVYPLVCHLLGITPAPNNGSLGNVSRLLATSGTTAFWISDVFILFQATGMYIVSQMSFMFFS